MDIKKLMAEGALDNISDDLFKSVSSYSDEVKAFQRQKAAEYADQVVAALKKIEQDIKDRYDRVGLTLEKRVLTIKDGRDGIDGKDGRDGKDGKPGLPGKDGRDGKPGKDGNDGADGKDGTSVVNAFLDFDNSLIIELSDGRQINAGAVLGNDFAEKIKIIANGGGTSQSVLDALDALQAQINALGSVIYQGTWNASTNTPTITSGSGTKGYYYVVSVAGSTSIDGENKWGVGDWIVYNGSAWQKVDGGSTGNLTTLDVSGVATIAGNTRIGSSSAPTVALDVTGQGKFSSGITGTRVDSRVSVTSSTSSITPDISAYDQYCVTAQAATLTLNAPTGTPVDGNKLMFRILDNGTSQSLSWNGTYTAIGVTLPSATTAGKTTYVGCVYNANNTRWDVIAVTTQA